MPFWVLMFMLTMLASAPAVTAAVDTAAALDTAAAAVDTKNVSQAAIDTSVVIDTAAVNAVKADTVLVDTSAVNAVKADTELVDTVITNTVKTDTAFVDTVITNTAKTDTALVDTVVANTARTDTAFVDTVITTVKTDTALVDTAAKPTAFADLSGIAFFALSIAIFIAAVVYLYSKKRGKRRFLTTMRLSVLDRNVQKACRYIESRFDDPNLTVDSVCKALVTGEAYLNTLFIKEVGIDVRDFITQVRVNGIKFFLKEYPGRGVEKICVQCGFESRAAAERPFARICGVGIDEYARSLPS